MSQVISYKEIEEDYTCGICHNVFEWPYRTNVCKHVFCKTCLYNASVCSGSTCPLCRKKFNYANAIYERKIHDNIYLLKYSCLDCSKIHALKDFNSQQCNSVVSPKPSLSNLKKSPSNLSQSSISSINSSASSSIKAKNRYTFKCPYCPRANFTMDSLRGHCNELHKNGPKEVVCPICVSMPWGDENQKSIDFIQHLNFRHRFEYDKFVDLNIDEEEMVRRAFINSIREK